MIVNSTYIYEIINLTCVIDFCVNFDQSNLLGMVILIEANIPPGDGLVTVDGYKMIEK